MPQNLSYDYPGYMPPDRVLLVKRGGEKYLHNSLKMARRRPLNGAEMLVHRRATTFDDNGGLQSCRSCAILPLLSMGVLEWGSFAQMHKGHPRSEPYYRSSE